MVIVKGSSASLKAALIRLLIATPVAASAGFVEITVGAVVSALVPVVKLQTKLLAKAFSAKSVIPVVSVAVNVVPGARVLAGVKVAMVPAHVTVPETGVAPCRKVKVAVVTVRGSSASLKVAATLLLMATPMAALAGFVEVTVGAVVSAVAPVVKLHTKSLASALPARSVISVVSVAVNVVLTASGLAGSKVAVVSAAA